ncbi:MAG: glycogen debranching enzyme family protein [Oscillospiraceae bacterium]|nr:glycogen debranching enzyme family protein [Oscillospiraceae bacterium]
MKFVYSKQDFSSASRAQENCCLLSNGLGGFSSVTAAYSVTRNDHALLMGARVAPNDRVNLVHRMSERLRVGEKQFWLSTQDFADNTPSEDGYRYISSFVYQYAPRWEYDVEGVHVTRQLTMAQGANTAAVLYRIENRSGADCTLTAEPYFQMAAKGNAPQECWEGTFENGWLEANGLRVRVATDAELLEHPFRNQKLHYAYDVKDGRPESGWAAACCTVSRTVEPGASAEFEIIFTTEEACESGRILLEKQILRQKNLERACGLENPVAQQLSRAAADFLSYRESTDSMTILAGFPFFGDWGRDTMIALPGCTLSRGDYENAKSLIRTFLAYEKDGLVPNLFPEGTSDPMYNTVDAALLLINSVWMYYVRTSDAELVKEAYPVMERIIAAYKAGTHHGIHMDEDGLICAGQGLDQVTWMDVRVEDILPTPRHGKPVEINAYWYSCLRIMERFAAMNGKDGSDYADLADMVKESFLNAFWLEDGYLKDVVSGTHADNQIRCNQIWAVTMPFCMLTPEQEKKVVDTVYKHLYTPCGLRTLSPEDAEFKPSYGGAQKVRDLAYHQGTVWPFPLGAYYLAYLKVHGFSEEAKQTVAMQLEPMEATLREGCIGQIPEIYSGLTPGASQGCFAQAWSVGEILRVYEALERGVF